MMPPLTREFDASEPLRVNVFPTRRGRRVTSRTFRVANVTIDENQDAIAWTISDDGQSVEFTAGDAAEDGQVISGVIEAQEEGADMSALQAEFEFTVVNVNPDGVELEAEPGNADGVELEPGTGGGGTAPPPGGEPAGTGDAGGDAGGGGEPPAGGGDAGTDAAGGDAGGDAGPAPAPAPAPGAPPGPPQVAPGFRPPPPPPPPPPAPPAAPRGGGGRGRGGNR